MLWALDLVIPGFDTLVEAKAQRLMTEFGARIAVDTQFAEFIVSHPADVVSLPRMVNSAIETLPTGQVAHMLRFEAEVSEVLFH